MAYLHLYEHPKSILRRRRARLHNVLHARARLLVSESKVVPHPVEEGLYVVYPIVFMVRKHKGLWTCDCPRFKKLGMCEDVLAVKLMEVEKKNDKTSHNT